MNMLSWVGLGKDIGRNPVLWNVHIWQEKTDPRNTSSFLLIHGKIRDFRVNGRVLTFYCTGCVEVTEIVREDLVHIQRDTFMEAKGHMNGQMRVTAAAPQQFLTAVTPASPGGAVTESSCGWWRWVEFQKGPRDSEGVQREIVAAGRIGVTLRFSDPLLWKQFPVENCRQ